MTRRLLRPTLAAAAAAAALVIPPPAAHADTLVQAAPGARGLASGGGWLTWAEPAAAGRWRLVVRTPGGQLRRPAIPTFGAVPDVDIGSGRPGRDLRRPLLAVYPRCAGRSTVRDCDVHALDLRAGAEAPVAPLARPGVSETTPDVVFGRYVVVLRGGSRPGLSTYDPARSPARRLRRLTSFVAPDAGWYGGRVAYTRPVGRRFAVEVRTLAGSRPVQRAALLHARPAAFMVQPSRVTWLARGAAYQTARTTRPGRGARLGAVRADRPLPAGTAGLDPRERTVLHALTAEGLVRLAPRPRFDR